MCRASKSARAGSTSGIGLRRPSTSSSDASPQRKQSLGGSVRLRNGGLGIPVAAHATAAEARRKAAAKKTEVYHAVIAKSVRTRTRRCGCAFRALRLSRCSAQRRCWGWEHASTPRDNSRCALPPRALGSGQTRTPPRAAPGSPTSSRTIVHRRTTRPTSSSSFPNLLTQILSPEKVRRER